MKSGYLFDSHVLLVFFQNEKGAKIVYDILKKSREQNIDRLICVINLGEIIYLTKKRFGDSRKLEILGRIHQLEFKVLSVLNPLVYQAAEIKADYPLSYADCFVVACAIEQNATIVTGDPEFKNVERLVKIEWIR
ncbi:MAG: type II toxin-antitoxin system VapC family toxin [Candidatus Desulfatibia sp.]|uniref:type II toxin-antitoxin system VapC family toxin n=1 Tax=Candidatus Desulfatibia sp. TaxID=3101189 RepID=UPI002F34DB42